LRLLVVHRKNFKEQTMAEHKHQQQDLRPGQQHLAYLRQDLALPHLAATQQVALAEAGLEAHLQRQHQAALIAIQDLEHQRLQQGLPQGSVERPLPQHKTFQQFNKGN
jgi:hypothetical protein